MTICVALTVAAGQAPDAKTPPAALRVELERTPAQRLIYLEHDGPYWAAGTKFAQVREFMQLHDEPGPLFMRYFRSQRNRKPGERASLIGFFAREGTVAQAPFQARIVASHRVARLFVEGQASSPRRLLKAIDRWVTDNGHATSGEVMEIYHLAAGGGSRIERTEFQLPLAAIPVDPPISISPPQPSSQPNEIPVQPRATAAIEESQSAEPAELIEHHGDGARESIPALVRAARFDRVAELVLPDVETIDANDQVWIGQVFFRIKAAGKGVARKNPEAGDTTMQLAEALLKRYRDVFKDRPSNPLVGATPASAAGGGSRATEQRRIMHQLDSLLSRIAFGAAGPDVVETEAVDVLERARKLLAK